MNEVTKQKTKFVDIVKKHSGLAAGISLTASAMACSSFNEYLCGANIVGYGILGIVIGTVIYRGWNKLKQSPEYQVRKKHAEAQNRYKGLWCSNDIADKLYAKGLSKHEIMALNGRYGQLNKILCGKDRK